MKQPILMTEEYWANSQFSIARYYGRVRAFDDTYVIVNKEGKDIYECTLEAEREGREKAIEPGEPCDLVLQGFVTFYRKLGRDKFLEVLNEHNDTSKEELEAVFRELTGMKPKKQSLVSEKRRKKP